MPGLPSIQPAALDELIAAGNDVWMEFRALTADRHHPFIPCDHRGAYEALRPLRARATTFVEFGSAAGVVTIMADLLGFEAYGIEIEPWLVRRSIALAERLVSAATFAEGTFVPMAYQNEIENLTGDFLTLTNGACAFDEFGLDLTDFDLVFAYVWPGEEEWLHELIRRHARADAVLLTYAGSEGFQATVVGDL
ncbi:MAG: hypothetical protein ABIP94_24360 [Planctomycetota bacterium]